MLIGLEVALVEQHVQGHGKQKDPSDANNNLTTLVVDEGARWDIVRHLHNLNAPRMVRIANLHTWHDVVHILLGDPVVHVDHLRDRWLNQIPKSVLRAPRGDPC